MADTHRGLHARRERPLFRGSLNPGKDNAIGKKSPPIPYKRNGGVGTAK